MKTSLLAKASLLLSIVLAILLIVAGSFIGFLWARVQYLEGQLANAEDPVLAAVYGDGTIIGSATEGADSPSVGQESGFAAAGDVEGLREDDHVRGDPNASILLIEYTDLECPFCKSFHPTVQQIVNTYRGEVAWVYRHFPLDYLHPKADKEAEALECADELGGHSAFWKLADKIFAVTPSNNGLDLTELPALAAQVGLDREKFQACLESGRYADHVEADYQSGLQAGINSTPSTILLDTRTGETKLVPGAYPFTVFKQEIDSMLDQEK